MFDFSSIPNGITHKELNSYLASACRRDENTASIFANGSSKQEEVRDLIAKWTEVTNKILPLLKDKNCKTLEDLKPGQAMALGTFQYHLILSLQAKAAYEQH